MVAPILGSLAAALASLLASSVSTPRRTLDVCVSPGCVADGSEDILDRIRALAPPGCSVEPGGCVSACGAGPVVVEGSGDRRIVHKRVGAESALELLEAGGTAVSPGLARGYDLVREAEGAASDGRHGEAVSLFEVGIGLALGALGLDPPPASDGDGGGESSPRGPGPQWLVRAQRGEAGARLAAKDREGAKRSAEAAVELSGRSDPLCFEVLAEALTALKDASGELEALRAMFDLPEDPDMPRDVANRRREWGFRLARLEREAAKS